MPMARKVKKDSSMTRITVSFPTDIHGELERLAEAKKVSFGWVVREAAEQYLQSQWPLFPRNTEKS